MKRSHELLLNIQQQETWRHAEQMEITQQNLTAIHKSWMMHATEFTIQMNLKCMNNRVSTKTAAYSGLGAAMFCFLS